MRTKKVHEMIAWIPLMALGVCASNSKELRMLVKSGEIAGIIRKGKQIGKGHFGKVYAVEINHKKKALKVQKPRNATDWTAFNIEERVLGKFTNSEYVIGTDVMFHDKSHGKHYIVMDLCLSNLQSYLQKSPESRDFLTIVHDCAMGLTEMHKKNIVHNDLHMENVLVYRDSQGKIRGKIGDLGWCLENSRKFSKDMYHPEKPAGLYVVIKALSKCADSKLRSELKRLAKKVWHESHHLSAQAVVEMVKKIRGKLDQPEPKPKEKITVKPSTGKSKDKLDEGIGNSKPGNPEAESEYQNPDQDETKQRNVATEEPWYKSDLFIKVVIIGTIGLVLVLFLWILCCCSFEKRKRQAPPRKPRSRPRKRPML